MLKLCVCVVVVVVMVGSAGAQGRQPLTTAYASREAQSCQELTRRLSSSPRRLPPNADLGLRSRLLLLPRLPMAERRRGLQPPANRLCGGDCSLGSFERHT